MRSPTPSEREKMVLALLDAGMNRREAENFCQQDNTIDQQIVQIPGTKAAKVLPQLAEMGLIMGVISIKIGVETSRRKDFLTLLEKSCGQKAYLASDFTGELESRTEPFKIGEDVDPKLVN